MAGPLKLIQKFFPAIADPSERKVFQAMADDALRRSSATDQWLFNFAAKHYDGDQRAALKDPRVIEVLAKAHPLGMMRANMYDAAQAKDVGNDTLQLLLAPNEVKPLRRADASLTHHGLDYHQNKTGLPERGVYIEGLSSTVPGGGTQLLKEVEAKYPGAAMYLQSLDDASSRFYVKKGFVPQPDRSSPEIFKDLFVKPSDVKLRAIAGVPAGTMLTEDRSVMNGPRLGDRVSEFLEQLVGSAVEGAKDPGNWLGAGLMGSGEVYQEGGPVTAPAETPQVSSRIADDYVQNAQAKVDSLTRHLQTPGLSEAERRRAMAAIENFNRTIDSWSHQRSREKPAPGYTQGGPVKQSPLQRCACQH